jgi:LacI family transcriptional regulator
MTGRLPTLSDVARRAGVSYATADRVVNGRGGVSEKSSRRVRGAVEELGYVRNVAAANLSQGRTYRFATVLPSGPNAFFGIMRDLIARERARLSGERVDITVEDVAPFDPAALSSRLLALCNAGFDGVALVGSDDPQVCGAMAALRERGIAVVTLVGDVTGAPSGAYIGIDNRRAGCTAGRLIGLAHGGREGRILPIIGALSARDHAERLAGLRETVAVHYPRLTVAAEICGRDRHELVEAQTSAALANDPAITAMYSAGAGNSGLIRLLGRNPRPTRPIVVLHELVAQSRRALEDGLIDAVIDQRPAEEIALAVAHMRAIADRRPAPAPDPVVPAIYVRENLPPMPQAVPEELAAQ